MSMFDRLKKGRPRPAWRYTAPGLLWQVQVGSSRVLVGEVRDPERMNVSFFSLDRRTGEPLWEGVNPGDRWWTGMEGVFDDVVLFHGFANPELPIHKGIHAVDALTGSLLWSDPDLRFGWCARGTIGGPALVPELQRARTVDLRTGRDLAQAGAEAPAVPLPLRADEPAGYPRPFDLLDFADPGGRERARKAVPSGAVESSIMGILDGARAILSFALPAGAGGSPFGIHLASVDCASGRTEWEETLLLDAGAAMPEPFFIQGGMLFAVSRRTTLVAIPL
jgi:outer membrane protein assembly factor BamB